MTPDSALKNMVYRKELVCVLHKGLVSVLHTVTDYAEMELLAVLTSPSFIEDLPTGYEILELSELQPYGKLHQ